MSETIGSWFGALGNLFDPYLQTVLGLWSLAVGAQIGTLVVGIILLLLSLDLLRASKVWPSYFWRLCSLASASFLIAAIIYGDFLAGPVKAAYTLVAERAAVVPPQAAAWTTVGVASVAALAYVGRKSA